MAPEAYTFRARRQVTVQPWVRNVAVIGAMVRRPLEIGASLAGFLDDPLQIGRSLNLALPVLDQETTFSGTWLRPPKPDDPGSAFHGGTDFSVEADLGQPRRLIDACAAADGIVKLLLAGTPGNRGVILEHEVASGAVFRTLYQHLATNSVEVAIGDHVQAGQRLGRIRRWIKDGVDISHLHFGLAVQGPPFEAGGDAITLWYLIDPFGVYDYHEPDNGPGYTYVPRSPGGLESPIRGAERTIHWAGNPPIEALRAEISTPYRPIRQVQARARRASAPAGTAAAERDQFLVWLEGIDEYFFVALGDSLDRPIERELIALLRRGYAAGRRVSLGYRFVDGQRQVSAAWLQS